jgi:hypothetical protein
MKPQNSLSPHDPSDLRIYMYRPNSDFPDGIERIVFMSPAHVPEGGGWMDAPEKVEAKPTRQVWRYRANNLWPDGIERALFESAAHVPASGGWLDSVEKVIKPQPDTRLWMYRANSDYPGGVEGAIFESPAHAPEGEGWVDTPAKLRPQQTDDEENGVKAGEASSEQGSERGHIRGIRMDLEFPRWMYRLDAQGEVEGRIFELREDLPENKGWVETPAMLKTKHKDEHNANGTEIAERGQVEPWVQQNGNPERSGKSGSAGLSGERQAREDGDGARGDRSGADKIRSEVCGEGRPLNGDAPQALNFEGLSNKALLEIAEKAGVRVSRHWNRARIEQALREADG